MVTRHPYFIGIGGAGMVWLADYAVSQGWSVSGSDATESPVTRRLAAAGAKLHYGCDPTQIPNEVTEAVITSAITPSSPSYPELQELRRRGVPVAKRAVWLGQLTRQMRTISIAGTHGKTTTTAMIGWILDRAGLNPTVFTGSTLPQWEGKTRIGTGEYLVLESDEFDRSFHHFSPQVAVILNIDADHLDYYTGGLPEIEHSFRRFLRNLPYRGGLVVAYGRSASVRRVCRGFSYKFRWYDEDHLWPGLRLQIPGQHNLLNATAAARVAHELGVSQAIIKEALADFPGVGRRFEYVGKWGNCQVYDDYAHHPQEIRATLQAAAERFAGKRFTLVFQPHQKARTQHLLKEFGRAFDAFPPHRLILAPIYEVAGREEELAVTSTDVAREVSQSSPGMEVVVAADLSELEQLLRSTIETEEVLMVMGAGNIRSLTEKWMVV